MSITSDYGSIGLFWWINGNLAGEIVQLEHEESNRTIFFRKVCFGVFGFGRSFPKRSFVKLCLIKCKHLT